MGVCVLQTRTAECIFNPLLISGEQIVSFTLFGGEDSSERAAAGWFAVRVLPPLQRRLQGEGSSFKTKERTDQKKENEKSEQMCRLAMLLVLCVCLCVRTLYFMMLDLSRFTSSCSWLKRSCRYLQTEGRNSSTTRSSKRTQHLLTFNLPVFNALPPPGGAI